MRVAVVGAGVAGLAAAHELARSGGARVTLYEKDDHLGGHVGTVAVNDGDAGSVVHLDLGFMVFNRATSPNMMEWFKGLGVETEKSDMSFSVSTLLDRNKSFEWGSHNGISGLLAQKGNSLSPSFWRMILESFKFKNHALKYLEDHERNPDLDRNETLGQFVNLHGYSKLFQDAYIIPMCSCIWSCPSQGVLEFPAFFVLSYCRDNNFLELAGHPEWHTVKSRSESYVNKVREELVKMGCQIKTSCEVKSVSSLEGGCYKVLEIDGSEEMYDQIIFSVHAPDALKVLGAEATRDELRILGAFQYTNSDVYLHHDESFMPRSSSAWSARNFLATTSRGACVTYWLNLLQNIGANGPFLVTLNPICVPNHVLHKWHTSHPKPSMATTKASLELNRIQGKRGLWFCGSYQGYGFHEDGLKAGKAAAAGLLGKKCDLLMNPKRTVPSWTEAGARLLVARFLDQYISIGSLSSTGRFSSLLFSPCCLEIIFFAYSTTQVDLGLADAYINGHLSFVDQREGLLNLLLILIANRDVHKSSRNIASKRGWWTPLILTAGVASVKYILSHVSRKNTVTQTRRNISEHYDLSNDFFALFLDPTMSYSCGIFKAEDESLEAAQLRKVRVLIDKANVEGDHHVLEIGSGWGNLAMEMVKRTGCKYTGITLSEEQLKYAKRKVKEAGLEDHITFLLCDYRQIPTCQKYDRIISCEMIEHVGHEYMDDFFGSCEYHLAEDGLFILQFSSIPEERYDEHRRSPDFMKEYIFPGGCLPSLARITSATSNASRLCIEHVENIGYHYYTTLMRWRDNFMYNKDKVLALGFDDKFIRKWEYYLIYCAAGFKSRTIGNYQIVFSRPGNTKLPNYVAVA
ncbi:hypothetical protein HU200_035135 [Digitaria exilis]|uniref:Amine oxidase domain-containing protein n=1 Tax=Digitaria exilis TaxID=1010633 RepID=A0A835BT53_9POAL|nr:hypothetical protein HU200_035135 [Digitaria exilis]